MKYTIPILIFFLFSTTNCSSDIREYSPYKIIRKVSLEENENVILSTISQVSLNSISSKMLISDDNGRNVVLYDVKTGKIIRAFEPEFDLSDSLAIKGKSWDERYRYLSMKDIVDSNHNPLAAEFYNKYIRNEFKSGIFLNDSIVAVCGNFRLFKTFKNESFNPEKVHITVSSGLVLINLKTDNKSFIPLENIIFNKNKSAFAQPMIFEYDKKDDTFLILCLNHLAATSNSLDFLFVIGKYDRNGKYLKSILNLPNEYIESKFYYKLLYEPSFTLVKNNIYYTFPYIEKVFNQKNSFNLKHLPIKNNFPLDYQKENLQEYIAEHHIKYFPNVINGLYVTESHIIVTLFHISKTDKCHLIQYYTKSGDLIKELYLDIEDDDGVIQKIIYDNVSDQLLVFRKSKEGWIIQFIEQLS